MQKNEDCEKQYDGSAEQLRLNKVQTIFWLMAFATAWLMEPTCNLV